MGLMGLMGCSGEVTAVPEAGEPLQAIALNVYTSQPMATRADSSLLAESAIPGGKSIGVYAYYHDNSSWSDDATPNFMFNQQATNEGKNNPFNYSPIKYWPNEEEDKLSFIAYYPYCDGSEEQIAALGLTPNFANTDTGLPTFDFVVKDTVKEQVDFLVSDLMPNQTKGRITDYVRFLFRHATAKIEFRVVVDEAVRKDLAYFTLKSIAITNINNEGTITPTYNAPVPPETEGTTSFSWTATGEHTYYCKTTEAYLLMPQTLCDDAQLVVNYDLAFKSEGTTYIYDKSGNPIATEEYVFNNRQSTVQLNTLKKGSTDDALDTWEANHHYVYVIRIGAKRIDYHGEVVDWGETTVWDDINVDQPDI